MERKNLNIPFDIGFAFPKRSIEASLKLVCFLFFCSTANISMGQNLDKHQWKNRILVIQSKDATSVDYQNQLKELTQSVEELKERKLVLYEITTDKYRYTDFQKESELIEWNKLEDSNRQKFDEASDFQIMLIGLDGGTKLRTTDPIKQSDIFNLIDSMPMRRYEIKN